MIHGYEFLLLCALAAITYGNGLLGGWPAVLPRRCWCGEIAVGGVYRERESADTLLDFCGPHTPYLDTVAPYFVGARAQRPALPPKSSLSAPGGA